ncbi:MAG: bacterial transcriptional activator domain-containing protein, partial [Chloroflexota bacterium]|nr:bacterial transcriptional activator domain-containing protein [Chloroflexota bacterium]
GDYLAEDLYEDWCAGERERLKELCLSVLTKLASLYAASGQYETAAHYCRKALARDNCRESVYRDLMRYLWWSGHGPEAIRQYRLCQDVLERELAIDPLPETTRLYQHIVQDLRAAQRKL